MNELVKNIPKPEQERFERIEQRIAELPQNQQAAVQAGIAMIELAMRTADKTAVGAGVLALAYTSCRIAAGAESVPVEEKRIVIPGSLH